jgi:Domain of unknown function (DUF4124)
MKFQRILLLCAALICLVSLPTLAEIYKWKDKDGVTRYTDTPPPSGTKSFATLGKKAAKTTPPSNPEAEAAKAVSKDMAQTVPAAEDATPEALAEKRRQMAETEKRNKAEKEAERKRRELNCNAAKANMQAYGQGGRIYRTNPQGEREYLGDEDLKNGLEQAQREMQENCN